MLFYRVRESITENRVNSLKLNPRCGKTKEKPSEGTVTPDRQATSLLDVINDFPTKQVSMLRFSGICHKGIPMTLSFLALLKGANLLCNVFQQIF